MNFNSYLLFNYCKIIVVPFKTVTSKNIWGQDYIPVGC